MRYLVTGAAGFIGSQLLRTLLERGHDATGWDAFTDYYDPALKEENAAGLPVERVDLAEDRSSSTGFDGVFHLAGQPGVASFGSVFPVYVRQNVLASQRLFEAAAAAGVRVIVRLVVLDLRGRGRVSDTRGHDTAAARAVRDHEARLRAPRARVRRASSGSRSSRCATSRSTARGSGRTWRSRRWSRASPRGGRSSCTATARSRAASPTSTTRSRRRSPRWSVAAPGSTFNVGGGTEVSMLEAIETLGEDRGAAARGRAHAATRGRCGANRCRHDAHPRRARAGSRRRRSRRASRLNGAGPLLGSRPHDASRGSRARRRAGSRPLLRLAAPQGALVASGRRSRHRRRRGHRARALRRLGLARADDRLPRPAVRAARRRPDPEPRDEPAHGERDHPLRGRAQARVGRERHPGLAAALVDLDTRAPRGRAAPRDQPADRDRREGLGQAKGRARRRRARRPRHRRVSVYVTEKVALLEIGSRPPRRSSRTSTSADRCGAGAAGRRSRRTSRSRSSSGSWSART